MAKSRSAIGILDAAAKEAERRNRQDCIKNSGRKDSAVRNYSIFTIGIKILPVVCFSARMFKFRVYVLITVSHTLDNNNIKLPLQ